MRRPATIVGLCVLMLMLAYCVPVSAQYVGDAICTLYATDQDAYVDHVGDYDWDVSDFGDDVLISVYALIDDMNNAVDYICWIGLVGSHCDWFGTPLGVDDDNLHTPNWDDTINSANFPVGQFEDKWLEISFDNVQPGNYIDVNINANIENRDNTPPTHSEDNCSFRITIVP